jgi:RsiW-degrading membrane proteinase PrsW (M82 family)
MPQVVVCSQCASKLKAPDAYAGRRVACPTCKAPVQIPPATIASTASQPSVAPKQATATPAPSTIEAQCPQCKKKLKAPAAFASKSVRCPACETRFVLPGAAAAASAAAGSGGSRAGQSQSAAAPPAPLPSSVLPLRTAAPAQPSPAAPLPQRATAAPARPLRAGGARPRFLYAIFLLGLTPLALQTFDVASESEADFRQRLQHTVASKPGLAEQLETTDSEEAFFDALPDGRIEGAHLARETWMHWLYALAAALIFVALIRLLFEPGQSTIVHLLTVLALTATVGVISLIAFQWIAEASQGVWVRGRGIIVALFYLVKFIGFSYHAALNPENGFLLSFFGFTCGVGLCEELTKILPVVVLATSRHLDWRGACALGLASGVGFGVAEGVMYSADMYNGLMTGGIYLTRFISCVALHAIWAASAAVIVAQKREQLDTGEGYDWVSQVLLAIAIPAVLHGLYDTLLKREMPGYALVIAAVSFAWLMAVVEWARSNDEPAPQSMSPALA